MIQVFDIRGMEWAQETHIHVRGESCADGDLSFKEALQGKCTYRKIYIGSGYLVGPNLQMYQHIDDLVLEDWMMFNLQ